MSSGEQRKVTLFLKRKKVMQSFLTLNILREVCNYFINGDLNRERKVDK